MAVDDQAARRRDGDDLNLVGARGGGERFALHQLDLRQAHDDGDQCDGEHGGEPQHARKLAVGGDALDGGHQSNP